MDVASRIYHLELTLDGLDPDTVILCEHKMSNADIARLNINNYIVGRYYFCTNSMGVGVVVMAKVLLHLEPINIHNWWIVEIHEIELCLSEYECNNKTFIFGGVYIVIEKINIVT